MSEKTIVQHQVKNPLTGEVSKIKVDIKKQLQLAEFEALKMFTKAYLEKALTDTLNKEKPYTYEKLQYLIVQLYQPATLDQLVAKIKKYAYDLKDIKEYNDVTQAFGTNELTLNNSAK